MPKTKPITNAELFAMPAEKRPKHPAAAHDIEGFSSLAEMLAADQAKAEAVVVDDETLERWFHVQVTALEVRYNRLAGALEQNERLLVDQPRTAWRRYWEQEATARYVYETLQQVREAGHVLACPNHGVDGTEGPEGHYEGLSLYGLVAGEGRYAWSRICAACAKEGPIRAMADKLIEDWEAKDQPAEDISPRLR